MGATQVEALHRRLLDHMRAVALEDVILTTAELRQLKTAASGLGLPDYFDDLRPTSPQDLMAARLRSTTINFSVEEPRDDIAILVLRNDA